MNAGYGRFHEWGMEAMSHANRYTRMARHFYAQSLANRTPGVLDCTANFVSPRANNG
jgi:hypothetical protein